MEKDERLKQVGGDHYEQMAVEPFGIAETMQLTPMQFTVLKYVSRWRRKNGVEDLKKATQTCYKAEKFYTENPFLKREERLMDGSMIRIYCQANGLSEEERELLVDATRNNFDMAASALEWMIAAEQEREAAETGE